MLPHSRLSSAMKVPLVPQPAKTPEPRPTQPMVMLSCLLLFQTRCVKIAGITRAERRRQDCPCFAQVASHGHEMSLRSSETFLAKFAMCVFGSNQSTYTDSA